MICHVWLDRNEVTAHDGYIMMIDGKDKRSGNRCIDQPEQILLALSPIISISVFSVNKANYGDSYSFECCVVFESMSCPTSIAT